MDLQMRHHTHTFTLDSPVAFVGRAGALPGAGAGGAGSPVCALGERPGFLEIWGKRWL